MLKISAVSYLNTFPFVYGILKSGCLENFRLDLDVPSLCAEKLVGGEVDIALVPAGALPLLENYSIISNYCIGATSKVRTVLLLSHVPLDKITNVHLDFDSMTSVKLVRVLAEHYWKITPGWKKLNPGQAEEPHSYESIVAIGDKTFRLAEKYHYVYDLAEQWINFTGLPFVFAVWISQKKISDIIKEQLNHALTYGIEHKAECIDFFKDKLPSCTDCLEYLEKNISFEFDSRKKEGLELFLKFLSEQTF